MGFFHSSARIAFAIQRLGRCWSAEVEEKEQATPAHLWQENGRIVSMPVLQVGSLPFSFVCWTVRGFV